MSTADQPPRPEGERIRDWTGSPVVDRDGSDLGTLEHVYLERESNTPTWGVIRAGRKEQFVPLQQANTEGGSVHLTASKEQVRSAPSVEPGQELEPETESRLSRHYGTRGSGARHQRITQPRGRDETGASSGRQASSAMSVPRSRGALSGTLLVLLGAWAALVPFVGPLFWYSFGMQPFTFTWDKLWINILPGAAIMLGGLMLGVAANRAAGWLGALLALSGGIWLLIGPSLSQLWSTGGPSAPIGVNYGSTILQVLAELGFYFALGALVTTLAAMAFGRLSVRSVKD